MARTLYEIGTDMQALEALLLETGGDISDPAVAAAVAAWESELETNLSAKVDGYARLIADMEARAEARKAEASRISDLAKADQKAADALRERLRFVFDAKGIPPVQTANFRVGLAKKGGKAPMDLRVGVDELPSWAVRSETVLSPDKDAIRARLEAGEVLSFAALMERGNYISIR
jgi:hypothetical protein